MAGDVLVTKGRLLAVGALVGAMTGGLAFGVWGAEPAPIDPVPTSSPVTSSTSTTSATTVSTTVVTELESLVIQGVGDVNFDPSYITDFVDDGYAAAFEGLDGVLVDDSLTVINLECPATDVGSQADREFSFQCDPAALAIARDNGVDVANLANNHGQDRGVEGLLDTIDNLSEAGIEPVGAGVDLGAATTPAVVEVDGWRVAVLGMGGVVPSDGWLATEDRPGMASGDDLAQMVESVRAAADVADVVVVTIHWGRELVAEPDEEDRAAATAMIAAGADVIFGHHPHRLGELEIVDGVPVFWTLGNFIWPRLSDQGATSAVGRVVITPEGEVTACLIPVFIERSGRPELRAAPPC